MAKLEPKDVHFWVYCPWCPAHAANAGFPMTAKVTFDVDWPSRQVKVDHTLDTQRLENHVRTVHPDKVGATS